MDFRIGIDVGGTKIDGIVLNSEGEILKSITRDTPGDYFKLITTLKSVVSELDASVNATCPVGIGSPGAWVETTGLMKNCNNTAMNGKPFLHDMQRLLNRPVRIANDADCMVVSEATDGAAQSANSVFGVIIGTGVGGGWVVNGNLVTGPNGLTGEWGHNPFPLTHSAIHSKLNLSDQKRACYCGRLNCVETFLSGRGLQQTHRELHGQERSAVDIGKGEDPEARTTVAEYCEQLAVALSVIVNALDPHAIVLAGGLSNINQLYVALPDRLRELAFSSEGQTKIYRAVHGDSSGRRGAAWLFPA